METCSKHGEYESHQRQFGKAKIWDHCPECIRIFNGREKEKEENNIPWLPERRKHMCLANYKCSSNDQKEKYERMVSYVSNFETVLGMGKNLCIVGGVGTGKTHLVSAIGVALHKAGYSIEYKRLYELMRDIKKTYSNSETKTEEEIINMLGQFDLLILDEVGIKKLSDQEMALLYEIIDLRYELVKPTIIVTNLSEEQLEEFVGARVMDRMKEKKGVTLNFDWKSYRRD